jgi:tRNA threonylcarbamoyl adenosine modification protein (Sua5/YciO/YrdC/YwlC family)
MAQYFQIVPSHPQRRLIVRAAQIVRDGGVIAYPTDSCYALGCHIGDKDAMLRLRRIRGFDERHHLTLMCRDLSDVGVYAKVDNAQYRVLRALTPGSYAFILRGTREVPRRLLHPKRKTIGVRVPDHAVAHALLAELGEPLLSTTALLPGDPAPLDGGAQLRERLEHDVDLILDAGSCGTEPTTVIDLTGGEPVVLRAGKGSLAMMGSEASALIK